MQKNGRLTPTAKRGKEIKQQWIVSFDFNWSRSPKIRHLFALVCRCGLADIRRFVSVILPAKRSRDQETINLVPRVSHLTAARHLLDLLISARPQKQTNAEGCRTFGDLDQLKSNDTIQKTVDWSPRRREERKKYNIFGQIYCTCLLISRLTVLRPGDQSTVFCIA